MTVDVHRLAAGYAVDALDRDEVAAFERHLPSCEDCRAELRAFGETASRLAVAEARAPRPELRAAVLDAVATTRQLPPVVDELAARRSDGRARRRPSSTPWAVAAAVLAVAAAGAVGVAVDARSDAARAEAARAEVVDVLAGSGARVAEGDLAGAPATVVLAGDRVLLVGERVPSPPEGLVYQLWLIDEDGPRSAGLLDVGEDGFVTASADGARPGASVGVTVEPAGGSEQPTTDPVMLVELPTA